MGARGTRLVQGGLGVQGEYEGYEVGVMADNFHQHEKKRRPKLWRGVSHLEFFCVTNSYKLAAIFSIFA